MKIDINGEINEEMLMDVMNKFVTYKTGEQIYLTIDSLGGYVDITEDILSLFESAREKGSKFTVTNTGDVMSCASIIWLFCDERNWNGENGKFLVHNPYVENLDGDSTEILETGIQLANIENNIVDLYSSFSNTSEEEIREIMNRNVPLTVEEIKTLNFATNL